MGKLLNSLGKKYDLVFSSKDGGQVRVEYPNGSKKSISKKDEKQLIKELREMAKKDA